MQNSPTIMQTEDDRNPILTKRGDSIKETTPASSKYLVHQKRAVVKSKSGVQRGKDRLAKEKKLKAEYIPPHSLLPSGIKTIEDLKNIRAAQKNQKTKIDPKAFSFGDQGISLSYLSL